jgi:DNA-binding response OmpR family regulator
MRTSSDTHRIQVLLHRLDRANGIARRCTAELQDLFALTPDDKLSNLAGTSFMAAQTALAAPIVDTAAMTVTWAGRSCTLGHTIPLRLMERLARRPNQFVPFARLLRDVWDDNARSDEAIRSAVRDLKARLVAAKMAGLADCLRAHRRHYGLFLPKTNS